METSKLTWDQPLAPWALSTPNGPEDQDPCSVEQSRFILCSEGGHCSVSVSISQAVKLICDNTSCECLHQAVPRENLFVCVSLKCIYAYGWCKGLQREAGESLGYIIIPIRAWRDLALKSHR